MNLLCIGMFLYDDTAPEYDFWSLACMTLLRMMKELLEKTSFGEDGLASGMRFSLVAGSNKADLAVRTAEFEETERHYLATCQKIDELLERKRRSEDETVDIAPLHQELSLIGGRLQLESRERRHEDEYRAVLQQIKEALWRKIEAAELSREFQKLHVEMVGLGHKLGFTQVEPPASTKLHAFQSDDIKLIEVERRIADLQSQIRGLHTQP